MCFICCIFFFCNRYYGRIFRSLQKFELEKLCDAITAAASLDAEIQDSLAIVNMELRYLSPSEIPRIPGPRVLPALKELEAEGWRLVRHCSVDDRWHWTKDNLAGTDVYGRAPRVLSDDPTLPSWSVKFDDVEFDEFLFATGDGSKWMVVAKDEIAKANASVAAATFEIETSRSFVSPYSRKAFCELRDGQLCIYSPSPTETAADVLYGGPFLQLQSALLVMLLSCAAQVQ